MYFEIMLKKVNWIFDSSLHHNNKKALSEADKAF